ncbi:diacylglycerol/lipid kinase family protein [Flaviflagellibacter deserti]|uniref:Diacylglycerol/lipid kinase family protein n=1 Tax=Flaviflagellibacter deserti TaxID=2267266 RepID=A0ABV9Z1W6_9HYPH
MRAAIVLNAIAGSASGIALDDLLKRFRDFGIQPELHDDTNLKLPGRIDAAIASNPDALVIGGGDGSIACSAQKLMGTGIPLGILPLGTMNLLAKDLGLPLTIPDAVAVIAQGYKRTIDVGLANEHIFLCKSLLGLPANIGQLREKGRGSLGMTGSLRLARSLALGLRRYPLLSLALRVDGKTTRIRTRALAVACNAYDEAFGRFLRRSHLDRGELVLYVPHELTFWRLLRLGAGLVIGSWLSQPWLEVRALSRLAIVSPRPLLRIMLDGEVRLMKPPIRFRILPGALTVFAPAESPRS